MTVKREPGGSKQFCFLNLCRKANRRTASPGRGAETSCCLHREGFIKKCRHAVFDGLHYYVSYCSCVAAPISSLTFNPTFSPFQQSSPAGHRAAAAAAQGGSATLNFPKGTCLGSRIALNLRAGGGTCRITRTSENNKQTKNVLTFAYSTPVGVQVPDPL